MPVHAAAPRLSPIVTFPASGAGRAETPDTGRTDPGQAKSLNVKDHKIRARAWHSRHDQRISSPTSIKARAQNQRPSGAMVGNRRRRWRKMVQFEYDYADCRRQALIFGVVRPFHCSKFQVFRVLPDGCSSRRDQSTARAPAWPTCGPLWRASSAPTSTRRSSSRTCRKPAEGGVVTARQIETAARNARLV